MRDLKAIVLGSALRGAHAANLPIVLGHKRHALALALDHQGKRRRLHAAGGTHVAKAAKLGERQVAREHRTPNEVDVLTALAGVGQVLVERDKVIEGLRDLGLVNEEYWARATGKSGATSRTLLRASEPISSPSRSKSVAMMTLSDFLARFLSERMSSFSAGSLMTGAR